MTAGHAAKVVYQKPDGTKISRVLAPYGFFFLHGNTYMVAARAADDVVEGEPPHTYNLNRVLSAQEIPKLRFVRPVDFDVRDFIILPFQMGPARYVATFELADGTQLQAGSSELTVKALSYASLDEVDFHKTDVKNNYLSFTFTVGEQVVSFGTVLFTKPKHFHFVDPKLTVEVNGDELTIKADAYAKYVFIENAKGDLVLEDNYFDMDKGEKTVKIVSGSAEGLTVKSVFDIK
jgi:hypothetical protein